MRYRAMVSACVLVGVLGCGCGSLDSLSPQYAAQPAVPGHPASATQPAAATQPAVPADRIAQGADIVGQATKNPTVQVIAGQFPWGSLALNAVGTIALGVLAIDQAVRRANHASRADVAEASASAALEVLPSVSAALKDPTAANLTAGLSAVSKAIGHLT